MTKDARDAAILALDLTYAAVFIPQSASRNANEKRPTLNWKVTLSRNGVALGPLDYSAGIAHVPGYKQHYANTIDAQADRRQMEQASETGKTWRKDRGGRTAYLPLPRPLLADVLYSLHMDASAADETFDDWCANYGYDTDSRKAFASYHECVQYGITLKRMLGTDYATLATIFQDY